MRIPQMSPEDQNSSSPTRGRAEPREQPAHNLDPRGSQNSFTSNESKKSKTNADPFHTNNAHSEGPSGTSASQEYQAQARQPINDAVASAFHSAQSPLSPELLSQLTNQITQSVLQQLRVHPLPTPAVQPGASLATEQPDTASSMAGSPPLDRAQVYTPPSPYRAAEEAAQTHSSPRMSSRSGQPAYGQASPPRRDVSPFSQGSHVGETDTRDNKPVRPPGPKRVSTGGDTTVLEKIWGKLFDPKGQPTVRLGQFLRGIAVHLIEDYEPKHSLVITPTKMQKYYEATKVANEIYPWQIIFDDRTSSISRLFRDLSVSHHLVQEDERFDQRPDIPGLTPHGFEAWATLILRAHPDQEFDRLAKTALDMPINNPDDMKERFPKELSRRQFPGEDEPKVAVKLQKAMSTHCNVHIASRNNSNVDNEQRPTQQQHKSSDTMRPPPAPPNSNSHPDRLDPNAQPGSAPPGRQSFSNLERTASAPAEKPPRSHPVSKEPLDSAIEEEHWDSSTSHPIERERKPYTANPGGGKNYDVESHSADEKPTEVMPGAPEEPKIKRSTSVSAKSRPNPIAIHQNPSTPAEFPDLQRARTQPNQPPKEPSQPRGGRNRSPSLSKEKDHRRSDNDVAYGSSYHSSTSHDGYRPSYPDRYAHRAQSTWEAPSDLRDRGYSERETRPRFQSVSASDGHHYASTGHEYGSGPIPIPSQSSANGNTYSSSASNHAHYPPNAYRDGR